MSGFKAGDVVVKVAGPCGIIPKGAVLRVLEVVAGHLHGELCQCLVFSEYQPRPGKKGFLGRNFRKIQKADDAFTAQMRALKPIKQQA